MTSQFLAADWRANCNSVIIDTANASLIPAAFTTDIDGNLRSIDGNGDGVAKPDLGAYEYSSNYNVAETICQGDTFAFGSMNLTTSGNYQNTLISSNGCDSIVNLTLSVLPADSGFVNANVCQGGSFTYNSQTYNQSGIYYQTTPNPGQCDSIIKITVNYFPVDTTVLSDSNIYDNQNFSFYGQNINASGTYYHSLNNINNCDSVIQQTFNYYIVDTIINDVFCSSSTYVFEGININSPGTYFTTIQNANNADSSIQLNLTILPVDTTILDVVYINAGSTYNFYGTNISSPGTYFHTTTSQLGCDSVLQLKVLTRRYVSVNGSGSKNGNNWANAYQASNLQTAINDISIAGGGQVWVAKGTYKRTTTNARDLGYMIYNNVEIYGGFFGNETDISQRTSFGFNQTNETRLSGDINTLNDSTDNTYIIIRQHVGANYCLIDGFTIRDAMNPLNTGEGGGVYLRQGGVLRNSVLYKNYAGYKGGGVYSDHGIIENCLIKNNKANTEGGGIYLFGGKVLNSIIDGNVVVGNGGAGIHAEQDYILIDSTSFQNNIVEGYGWGAGLSIGASADTIRVTNSEFTNNQSVLGAALYMSGNANGNIIRNCSFENNTAIDYLAQATNTSYDGTGGAVIITNGKISNSTFINNSATTGGAAYLNATAQLDNCYFYNNSSDEGGAVYIYQGGFVTNSTLTNNQAADGGAVYIYNGGKISKSLLDSNYSSNDGGGIYISTSGEIEDSRFIANHGDDGGAAFLHGNAFVNNTVFHSNSAYFDGGAIYNQNNDGAIINCEVFNNYSRYNGGGIYQDISNNNNGLIVNTNIFNNQARLDGGGVYFYFGGELINCNINNNKAEDQGGGVYIYYKAKIKNSVIWGNDSLQIHQLGYSSFTEIDTTALMGGYSGLGAGSLIINLDSLNSASAIANYPYYLSPTSFVGNINSYSDSLELMSSDWNLNCGSALIDKGNNNILPDTISKDLKGNDRFNDGDNDNSIDVDLGPIEAIYSYEIDIILCENDTFFLGSQPITQAGTYSSSLTSSNGCDSNLTVNISISPIDSMQVFETICSNQDFYFGSMTLNQSGIYNQVFTSQNGCDSVVELNLTVLPIDSSTILQSICEGSNFVYNGKVYNQSGIYYDTLVSVNSCDSIVKIELTVNQVDTLIQNEEICEGNSYNFFGNSLTTSGIYYHSITSSNLCDSVIELNLTVNPIDTTILNEDICYGNSYYFFGNSLNQSGTYYHTLTAASFCDSIIQLNLNIRNMSPLRKVGMINLV